MLLTHTETALLGTMSSSGTLSPEDSKKVLLVSQDTCEAELLHGWKLKRCLPQKG